MDEARLILLLLMILGVLARNSLIVAAAGMLLVLQHLRLQVLFRHLEQRGLELGLILLLVAVLVPFAGGRVGAQELQRTFTSVTGAAGVAGGMLAAWLSGAGVTLMQDRPEVIIGLVVGSILGVVLLRGIPVGPLAAAGFAALLLRLLRQ